MTRRRWMTSRRDFLAAAAAILPGLRPGTAPLVQAVTTPFHGHPDGQTTLVRFEVGGVDAPAARLRVFASSGRLLGTAGLVRRGDFLSGQLWLPLTAPITVRSDLETPVTRGVHRTTHRLSPTPRWIIHWLTLAEPVALRERLAGIPLAGLGDAVAELTAAGVRLNPWSDWRLAGADHLDLLRLAVPARRLSATTGIHVSERALLPEDERDDPFVLRALAGSGIEAVVLDPTAVAPAALGLDAGRARMTPVVEAWLRTLPAAPPGSWTATLIGTDPDFARRALPTIEEWNGLYAYPRIVVGG